MRRPPFPPWVPALVALLICVPLALAGGNGVGSGGLNGFPAGGSSGSGFATLDGGPITVTTLTADVVDAGVALINGQCQVLGPLIGQYLTNTGSTGSANGTARGVIASLDSTDTAGLWLGVAPGSVTQTNYAVRGNTTDVYLRAANHIYANISGTFRGDFSVVGLDVTGKISSSNATTCTLDGASPSTCTASVTAGAKCQCTPVGTTAAIAAGGCAVSLTSTTLTATSANGLTNVVNILCDK